MTTIITGFAVLLLTSFTIEIAPARGEDLRHPGVCGFLAITLFVLGIVLVGLGIFEVVPPLS